MLRQSTAGASPPALQDLKGKVEVKYLRWTRSFSTTPGHQGHQPAPPLTRWCRWSRTSATSANSTKLSNTATIMKTKVLIQIQPSTKTSTLQRWLWPRTGALPSSGHCRSPGPPRPPLRPIPSPRWSGPQEQTPEEPVDRRLGAQTQAQAAGGRGGGQHAADQAPPWHDFRHRPSSY